MSRRSVGVAVLTCLVLTCACAAAGPASAQGEAGQGTAVTLLTAPPEARVSLHGTSHLVGPSPVELPAGWSGRYTIQIGAPGYATGKIALAFPSTGQAPYSLSEAPGLSAGLLFRSLNFPGAPDYLGGHEERGLILAAAAVGGGIGAARAEQMHSRDSKRSDLASQDQAEDDRNYRNHWLGYVGAVWALSALDYIERGRVQVLETTPTRVTLGIPWVTRGGALWRSMLVPGAGQEYAGERSRGLAWLSATLACGAAFVIADFEHERDLSRLYRGEEAYAALDSTLKPLYRPALVELEKKADTSRKWRKGFAVAAAGVYALNLLDALAMPIRRDDGTGEPRFSLDAPVTPERAALRLSYRF
jgi:hypothetical protein